MYNTHAENVNFERLLVSDTNMYVKLKIYIDKNMTKKLLTCPNVF
jgi:hypothetical protein